MRVVMCAETFTPAVNGVVNSVRHVARCLHAAGHEVTVVAPTGDDIPVPGGHIPVVTVPSVGVPGYRTLRIARPGVDLRRVLFDLEPDVVHLASPAILGQAGIDAARVIDRPVAAVFQTDLAAFIARHRAGVPVPTFAREGLRARTWRWLREIHAGADVTLAPSRATLEHLQRQHFPRLALWPRGVDSERFHPDHRDAVTRAGLLGGRELLVGVVARLAAEKRIDLLGATSRLPGVRVVVVGEGPLRAVLQRELPDAVFTGQLEGVELGRVVASLDVLAHPGADETFCQSVQESLAAGVPAVVAASGGPLDLVDDDRNGLLWRGDDPADLAALVGRLRDATVRDRLAQAARPSVEHRTWEGVTAALVGHYERIVAHRSVAGHRAA
ncbi:glycosyltransferase [Jatrophihabitans sp. YIM 134969]